MRACCPRPCPRPSRNCLRPCALGFAIQQQTRAELVDEARQVYAAAGVQFEIAPFFSGMAERLGAAHLMIGRAGCAHRLRDRRRRPPVDPGAPEDRARPQGQNARLLAEAGGALVLREDAFSADSLASLLASLLGDPDRLAKMAASARSVARPGRRRTPG